MHSAVDRTSLTHPQCFWNCQTSSFVDEPRSLSSFDNLLRDSDGVKLFTDFLASQHSCRHFLDFWFACKGFQTKVSNEPEKSLQVAKVIYRTYIKPDAEFSIPLNASLRHDIAGILSSCHKGNKSSVVIQRSLFDGAQTSVKSLLEENYFPLFLKFLENSPYDLPRRLIDVCSGVSGLKSYERDPIAESTFSASVLECTEANCQNSPGCVEYPLNCYTASQVLTHPSCNLPGSSRMAWSLTTTPFTARSNKMEVLGPKVSGPHVPYQSWCEPVLGSTVSKDNETSNTVPDDGANVPYSNEPQSVTLETLDSDAPCPSDRVNHMPSTEQPQRCRADTHLAAHPRSWSLTSNEVSSRSGSNRIRHSVKHSVQKNLAESDPRSFVSLLTSRLEKVKESRVKMERLLSCVNQMEEKDMKKSDMIHGIVSPPHSNSSLSADITHTAATRHPYSTALRTTSCSNFDALISRGLLSSAVSALPSTLRDPEDPQVILDYHCSRIWSDDQDPSDSLGRSCDSRPCPDQVPRNPKSVGRIRLSGTSTGRPESETVGRRRKNPLRSSQTKNTRSDARSIASWDSGVVDSGLVSFVPGSDHAPSDGETKSVIAAASLQALSSSLTELAVVNNEVTSKLAQHLTKQLQKQKIANQQCLTCCHPSGQNPKASDLAAPVSTVDAFSLYLGLFTPNQCLPASGISQRRPTLCGCSRGGLRHPPSSCLCTSAAVSHQLAPSHMHPRPGTGASLSVGSDSSSAFDSGISSTYDHLPAHGSRLLTNRSLSLHQGHSASYRSPSSHYSHPPERAPSSVRPCCSRNACRWTPCSGNQRCHNTAVAQQAAPLSTKSATHYAGSGQLLRHWLMWQSAAAAASASDDHRLLPTEWTKPEPAGSKPNSHRHRRSTPATVGSSCMVQSMGPALASSGTKLEEPVAAMLNRNVTWESGSQPSNGMDLTAASSASGLVVGYYLCDDPVPYRTVWIGPSECLTRGGCERSLTLGQFKQLIAKKGVYRYFFKKPSNEFDCGAVHEEFTEDDSILPLWEGKVVARIERAD